MLMLVFMQLIMNEMCLCQNLFNLNFISEKLRLSEMHMNQLVESATTDLKGFYHIYYDTYIYL